MSKFIGLVSAYAYAKSKGYTGTEEEFAILMAEYASVTETAVEAVRIATESARSAAAASSDVNRAAATVAQQAAQVHDDAETSSENATTASEAKETAVDKALDSEAWAVGQRDGEDVGSSDPAYHNNAKYYAEQTATDRTAAQTAAQTATAKAGEAAQSASAAAESARTLTIDTEPTEGSTNAVASGAVYDLKEDFVSVCYTESQETICDWEKTTSTTTPAFSIGATVESGTECTVTVTVSEASASATSFTWRNGSTGNKNSIGSLPAGETTATFTSTPNADVDTVKLGSAVAGATYGIKITKNVITDNVGKNTSDIASTSTRIDNIDKLQPVADVLNFKVGSWYTPTNFKTTVTYRVGADAYTFDKDVVIATYNGYFLEGYVDNTFFGNTSQKFVPAGSELKLTIRKVWEDTSETVTVADMTSNMYILGYNADDDFNRLIDTFYGIDFFRTAGFCGDSYTAMRLGSSWVEVVEKITGVDSTIFAQSGNDTATWIANMSNGLPAVLADTAKDLYWLALGINDGTRVDNDASYIGSSADISGSYADYPDTLWGNMGHIIEAIQDYAPSAKIVLYKPIFISTARTLQGTGASKNGIKFVRDALGEIAEHYGLPCMDALDDVFFHTPFYTAHMASDGTHPGLLLNTGVAKANLRLFSKCMRDNLDYFDNMSFA